MSPAKPKLDAIVLAAGRSKRFKGARPKVLHPLAGRQPRQHAIGAARPFDQRGAGARQRVCSVGVAAGGGRRCQATPGYPARFAASRPLPAVDSRV